MSGSEPRQGRGRRPGDTSVGGWVGKNIPPAERQSFWQAICREGERQKEQSEAQSPRVGAGPQGWGQRRRPHPVDETGSRRWLRS